MNLITKIACRTVGTAGMGFALYNATKLCSQFSRNTGQYQQQKHLEKAYFDSRTIDSISYTKNAIREKTFDLRSRNPLPSLWGKTKGGFNGFMYGLGDNLAIITCSALALTCKNTLAKLGAIGAAACLCYDIAREGFGLGKHHPMN